MDIRSSDERRTAEQDIVRASQFSMMERYSRLIFFSVLGLTVGCVFLALIVSLFGGDPLSRTEQRVFDVALSFFMLGAGAIIGLLGGKAVTYRTERSSADWDA